MTQVPGPAEFADHHGEPSPIEHNHSDVSGGWLRAAVFGAMDGLVTNIALIAGVGGGGADRQMIILTGMAGLVAGAFSMALGEFASVDTQNDAVRNEVAVERAEIKLNPRAEEAELARMYREMGLSPATADAVAAEVHDDPELAVKIHVTQELGVDPDEQPSPWTAAVSSFLCFCVGGIIPLLPFLLGSSSLALGLGIGAIGLFVLGALTSRFTTRSWWVSGLRQLAFGALATGATYLVGSLIGVSMA
ncbi:MAG TPA: VIT1/CCC1 transporter family protein [Pseudonocardia sp.]|nr:VIT1/CCC1 transporter family protein [Pseudonocardia sp.]